ncbi:MAG TPA: hydroxymethylbilane synthase, partial [Candidatus Thermoplasmatota archaeon]|nr:hydroxymethylbilane synthase [Candidatus Thermoplasmatota archaeon]
ELPKGARVGTSSPRRTAQLKHKRPDLQVVPLRGNVPTRAGKVGKECDAVLLAAAGLERLGLAKGFELSLQDVPTAPGQGAIAVTARRGSAAASMAARADHAPTRAAVEVERAVLRELGTGCATPMGCSAWWQGDELRVVAEVLAPDGSRAARLARTLAARDHLEQAYELGVELAQRGVEVHGRW